MIIDIHENTQDILNLKTIRTCKDIASFEVLDIYEGEDGEGANVIINGIAINFGGELGYDSVLFVEKYNASAHYFKQLKDMIANECEIVGESI